KKDKHLTKAYAEKYITLEGEKGVGTLFNRLGTLFNVIFGEGKWINDAKIQKRIEKQLDRFSDKVTNDKTVTDDTINDIVSRVNDMEAISKLMGESSGSEQFEKMSNAFKTLKERINEAKNILSENKDEMTKEPSGITKRIIVGPTKNQIKQQNAQLLQDKTRLEKVISEQELALKNEFNKPSKAKEGPSKAQIKQELAESQAELKEIKSRLESFTTGTDKLKEEKLDLSKENIQLKKEIESEKLKGKSGLDKHESAFKLKVKEEEINKLRGAVNERESALQSAQEEIKQSKEELADFKEQLKTLQNKVKESENALKQIKNEKDPQVAILQKELKDTKNEMSSLQLAQGKELQNLETLKSELKELKETNKNMVEVQENKRAAKEAPTKEMTKLDGEANLLYEEITKLKESEKVIVDHTGPISKDARITLTADLKDIRSKLVTKNQDFDNKLLEIADKNDALGAQTKEKLKNKKDPGTIQFLKSMKEEFETLRGKVEVSNAKIEELEMKLRENEEKLEATNKKLELEQSKSGGLATELKTSKEETGRFKTLFDKNVSEQQALSNKKKTKVLVKELGNKVHEAIHEANKFLNFLGEEDKETIMDLKEFQSFKLANSFSSQDVTDTLDEAKEIVRTIYDAFGKAAMEDENYFSVLKAKFSQLAILYEKIESSDNS
ncbi:MAG: hypothetical protein H0U27_08360, partial [Nitrosopumilus sp.]|nr:hypothetical protein [Nitrosopumilus sp.]